MSREDIIARTAARKAAGANQTYPKHAGKTARSAKPTSGFASFTSRVLPCVHVGPDSGPKGWHYCEHPDTPLGDIVCPCRGCGKRCPGYTPTAASLPTAKLVSIPPLSPPALPAPESRRAVVTVVSGDSAKAVHALSRPFHESYARRLGADYLVLSEPPPAPAFPISAKYRLGLLPGHYDRFIFLDADAVPLPGCPDLFAEVREDEFGFHDDLPGLTRLGAQAFVAEYRELRAFAGLPAGPCRFVANTGVLVFAREHLPLLAPPTAALPLRHCAEQNWYTARLHDAGVRLRRLPADCNFQWWEQGQFKTMPKNVPVILHFSGLIPSRSQAERLKVMRTALAGIKPAAHPPAFDPPRASHEWEIDRTHLLMLAKELCARKYRRVLEIGSFRGYSTRAFLHALTAGAVQEVHLCDPNPTPELLALIEGTGAVLHKCTSAELLARDCDWDLVFVDGDHSTAVVADEARLIVAAGVPCVVAHDVCSDPAHPQCGGPPALAAALAAADYRCEVDAKLRPGERTERGLLVARK